MNTTTYVIETTELGKAYKNIQAFQSLKLKVQQNSIFGFLGPNGAGKTTTIKLMLGLIRPTAGSATIFGMDTIQHHPPECGHPCQGRLHAEGAELLRAYDRP